MAFWFEKDDMRRFRRLNLPVKAVIRPEEGIQDAHIFAYGIDYFPPTVQTRIQKSKKALWHWVHHIQDQQEVLEPFFKDFEQYIAFFGDWVNQLANGQSPRLNRKHWIAFHSYAKGVQRIQSINQSAPKTFQYFDALNHKMILYFQHLAGCFEGSTPHRFKTPSALPNQFVIDAKAKRFEPDTFQNVPLAQALYHLNALLSHYFIAYQHLIDDMTLPQTPHARPELEVNLSEGGAAIFVPKRFRASGRCKVTIYFSGLNQLLEMQSVLVRRMSDSRKNLECNAFDFVFPNAHYQHLIQLEIDRYEVAQSKKAYR
ncbi:MAG: hypothetical protein CO158_08845 [Piscirickettsiaceae bacterium CG_4_9_14_3_um_filter_43_564]|nr:hypothetical protein [Thiomicrospira sp.]OIP95072.1 MAG: hypothetical protein AUK56_06840 [Thiomicrospira sp. CG2_30_44_34]PIQ05300.1 MAG: hypothetical protein COW74_02800 [Piscirickettsiaceae bacterium CG18_big_fil_WC_8_21_14_2_50_44_103]PIU38393.1 MAG: hypothetical protein COT01_06755 [Piscirickettsiaceae bacterium CG07_land_8_20_14_0_80_44_28]PIW58815.1 MAG: hypothetical protein COW14_00015 [Piscirickettsiaceae bacterium CG12_big_fil_rev_8_21_14_0_65_44_934]PIW78373.1 MAG: hypothetical p